MQVIYGIRVLRGEHDCNMEQLFYAAQHHLETSQGDIKWYEDDKYFYIASIAYPCRKTKKFCSPEKYMKRFAAEPYNVVALEFLLQDLKEAGTLKHQFRKPDFYIWTGCE